MRTFRSVSLSQEDCYTAIYAALRQQSVWTRLGGLHRLCDYK